MINLMHDLTDLLGGLTDTKFWFVKRLHEGRWHYLYSYEEKRDTATWTRLQEKAIAYTYEKAAIKVANKLSMRCDSIEVKYERSRK